MFSFADVVAHKEARHLNARHRSKDLGQRDPDRRLCSEHRRFVVML